MKEEDMLTLIKMHHYVSTKYEPDDEEQSVVYDRFEEYLENFLGNLGLSEFDKEESLRNYQRIDL